MENILRHIRITHPTAYAYGFTMNNEGRLSGLDSGIELSPYYSMFGFQFKRMKERTGDTFWFEFNNNKNHNQHFLMLRAAFFSGRNPWVFYALPIFEDAPTLANHSPDFLSHTFFIDPRDVGILDGVSHKFEVNPTTRSYVVHSKTSKKQKLYTWTDLMSLLKIEKLGKMYGKNTSIGKNKKFVNSEKLSKILDNSLSKNARLSLKTIVLPELKKGH